MIESARGVHALLVQDVVDRKVIKQVRLLLCLLCVMCFML